MYDCWPNKVLIIFILETDKFDEEFYREVTDFVSSYNTRDDSDIFLERRFTPYEVRKAIGTLHPNKAPGFDEITTEHLRFAGPVMCDVLCVLFNAVRDLEYIPKCFKRGVQVPLYKGKNTCILDPNNYRGITLLPSFNKLFDILLWRRMKGWWQEERVISELQGACRAGSSCIHTSFNLRETLATAMEASSKCFVAFFDVAKAFDTVWVDGLFRQIYDIGIKGKTWRLLYRGYMDFKCCVKLKNTYSDWYKLQTGIHQGGFMSLMKYAIFINSLLVKLKNENICCKIFNTPSTPLGYADDVATACLSKPRLDRAMEIVYTHGCVWRYELNAKKSGVLVLGENRIEHARNSRDRVFKLGPNRVKEKIAYEHVGIHNTIFNDDYTGIEERISKGRRAFNAIAGIGIRKGGLTMATCNVIFWSVVVPTALHGCEMWILDDNNLNIIETFQNYVGKRMQRLHPKSPNACSYYGLGWMRLERIVQIKKLMFIRTIMVMDESELSRIIFCERTRQYMSHPDVGNTNRKNSQVFDLLNTSIIFGLYEHVINMVVRGHFYAKSKWREMVWSKGWKLEDTYWLIERRLHRSLELLGNVYGGSRYIIWWQIADKYPENIKKCEVLSKILCHSSILRSDDLKLKSQTSMNKLCTLCDQHAVEDARHFIMHCDYFQLDRDDMFNEIGRIDASIPRAIQDSRVDILYVLLGHPIENVDNILMEKIWLVALTYVYQMYVKNSKEKRGIG